ncbi:MAG: hypothetical protein V5A22_07215 [Salinivenus sp.]
MHYESSHGGCNHSDHHTDKMQAEMQAARMGLSGTHTMQCNGETMHMPGSSHKAYKEAKNSGGMM